MSRPSITTTNNYRLFVSSDENRPLSLNKRKRLRESMAEYGFLRSFPLSCSRNGAKKLTVKDGQHRLAVAEELGLPVHYYVEEVDYDIAKVNCTQEKWNVRDYALKHATAGRRQYQEGIVFAEQYGLPLSTAFCLLAGTISWTNIKEAFISGTFKIKDRQWAETVGSVYATLVSLSSDLKNARCLEACMACCRADEFDPSRLIAGAKRCREKLVAYSTKEAYLEMLEAVYNFGRKALFPLKIKAQEAMRSRNIKNR